MFTCSQLTHYSVCSCACGSPLELQTYNSLQDEHLVEYYSSPQRRRHLRRMGLVSIIKSSHNTQHIGFDTEAIETSQITKDGMLVDELTFQRKALEKEQRRRYKDMMATTTATRVGKEQVSRKKRYLVGILLCLIF